MGKSHSGLGSVGVPSSIGSIQHGGKRSERKAVPIARSRTLESGNESEIVGELPTTHGQGRSIEKRPAPR